MYAVAVTTTYSQLLLSLLALARRISVNIHSGKRGSRYMSREDMWVLTK